VTADLQPLDVLAIRLYMLMNARNLASSIEVWVSLSTRIDEVCRQLRRHAPYGFLAGYWNP
jgi:hypothetical protein